MIPRRRLYGVMVLVLMSTHVLLASEGELPTLHKSDFEESEVDQFSQVWETTDDAFWKVIATDRDGKETQALRVTGKSAYAPPVRSPHSIAWLRDRIVGDFVMTVRVQSTNAQAGNHRDLCLFWGAQEADQFYYVHFGAKADPHACQIFVVDGEPRKKITVLESSGTPWTDGWHTVRVERSVADGEMRVYFDDLEKPVMTAKDQRFRWGRVGLGTFDDHGNFDDFELRGELVERPQN